MPHFCTQCGKQHKATAKFCPRCGAMIDAAATNILEGPTILDKRYEILGSVKSGAMGSVTRARDIRLDTIVAIKQKKLSPASGMDAGYVQTLFIREAALLSSLDHSGIPRIMDYFVERDRSTGEPLHYLVMEFVDGRDFETIMSERKGSPLPVDEAMNYFFQVLDILDYLHRRQPPVVFRDLNPRNIMLREGRIFLVDFGIARLFTPQIRGTAIGTAGYAPPEQYKGDAEPRSDIYSLGAVMHYFLTARNPEADSQKIFTFESIRRLNNNVPQYLDSLIMTMLDLVPDRRPPSARHIILTLQAPLHRTAAAHPPQSCQETKPAAPSRDVDRDRQLMRKYPDIFECVFANDIGALRAYLDSGTDINAANFNGFSPLHCAIGKGYRELAEYLISRGADIRAKSNKGWTALFSAAVGGYRDITELLIARGADVSVRDVDGVTPLHWAAEKGSADVASLLISRGTDLNAKNKNGDTPLHYACRKGHADVVELLIKKGSDVNARGGEGKTPLHLACSNAHGYVAEVLLREGANVKAKDEIGNTPMKYTYRDEIKALLRKYHGK